MQEVIQKLSQIQINNDITKLDVYKRAITELTRLKNIENSEINERHHKPWKPDLCKLLYNFRRFKKYEEKQIKKLAEIMGRTPKAVNYQLSKMIGRYYDEYTILGLENGLNNIQILKPEEFFNKSTELLHDLRYLSYNASKFNVKI